MLGGRSPRFSIEAHNAGFPRDIKNNKLALANAIAGPIGTVVDGFRSFRVHGDLCSQITGDFIVVKAGIPDSLEITGLSPSLRSRICCCVY